MANQLDITDSQRQSSDRHDITHAVYLLSGTLVGRDSVPDATFYWATHEVTAFGQAFQPYLGPPRAVTRGMGFEPGSQGIFPDVRVPVRNLPFAHSESMVAAITDQDFRVENTTATLRVAYVRPGQDLDALADADWTPLILNGFLGPADDVTLDGLVLPVFNRGARRNQALRWPRLPSIDTNRGGVLDLKDSGRMPPFVIGVPQGWVRVPGANLGVRGHLASGYDAGALTVTFSAITDGLENLVSGNVPATDLNKAVDGSYGEGTGRAGLMLHYMGPVYEVVSATLDAALNEYTVTLASGLAADVPRGGFVQQWGPGFNPETETALVTSQRGLSNSQHGWFWYGGNVGSPGASETIRYGWLFPNGEVVPAEPGEWTFTHGTNPAAIGLATEGGQNIGAMQSVGTNLSPQSIFLTRGTRLTPKAPVYYDPVQSNAEINTQPEFSSTQSQQGTINYPTGGTGTDNANARDGNDQTFAGLPVGNFITLTFNDAPSPFENGDVIASTLHVIVSAGGAVNFEDVLGSTTFGQTTVAGTYRFTQATARNFNETIRCEGAGGAGGAVVEAWWEHTLSAVITNTRTQDVTLVSANSPIGPEMVFAELVMQLPQTGGRVQRSAVSGGAYGLTSFSDPLVENETVPGLSGAFDLYTVPYPPAVMRGLHALLGEVEGDVSTIDQTSYTAAQPRFVAENVRLTAVWTDETRPRSWTELETKLGEQSRSFMFYGPSGHEILFLEDSNAIEVGQVQQSFRLPGCPGANTLGGTAALMERTLTTELVNIAEARWDPEYLDGATQQTVSAQNDVSVADIGRRTRDRGAYDLSMHTPWPGNSAWGGAGAVSGLAQFYADRSAFASTRFTVETAWVAHGLDRGSIIRVSYPVSSSPPSYRNVTAEVEEVTVSPISDERYTVKARAVSKPSKGLEPNLIWTEVFTQEADQWTDRLLQEFDTWADYWAAP